MSRSFDDFLKEEGIYEESTGYAMKRVLAWQLAEAMKAKNISKTEMARRLKTSRTQLAAAVVGKRLIIRLEDLPRSAA